MVDNWNNNVLILNEGPTDGINNRTVEAEKNSINFSKENTKLCLD